MMLSLVAMLFGAASAQTEVTLNFDEDYQTLFPTIPGLSCQANADQGIEASSDGDFTATTTSTAVQGVTVTVAPAEDAKTPSRLWASSPRLRMYSGTFTVSGKDITKIVFNAGSNFNLSTSTGSLEGKTWSGQADEIVFDVAKNTQLKSIVVTIGGEPGGNDKPDPIDLDLTGNGTLESPFTAADAAAVGSTLEQGAISDQSYYIKGKISAITFTFDVEHGTATFYISEDGTENDQFLVYAAYYLGNRSWKDGDTQIAIGDEVIVYGQLTNYKGTPETASKKNYIYSLNGVTDGGNDTPDPQPQAKDVTVTEALAIINALEDGKSTSDEYNVKGFVIAVEEISAQYGNATFVIADSKDATEGIKVFRAKGFNKENITDENLLKVGDEVVVTGKLQKYVDKEGVMTPEVSSCYIVSINGKTDGGDPPVPEVKSVGVGEALAIIDALEDGKKTSDEYIVKGYVVGTPDFQRKDDGSLYGNVNFAIADEQGGAVTLTVFRAKSFDNEAFTEENISILKEGDLVEVQGLLQKYVNKDGEVTPEVSSCYLISINGQSGDAAVNAITVDKAQGQVYNLAGQRVTKAVKGLYIQNGKKFIVK